MSKRTYSLAVFAAALIVTPIEAQTALKPYAALGDSLTAGYTNGSLVKDRQVSSYPYLIAHQMGIQGFEQPWMGQPGIPAELVVQQLLPSTVIAPKAASPGAPENLALARPYDNLGVPGATSVDCLTRVSDGGGFHDLILRKAGTAVQQVGSLAPSMITLWIGNNDVLGGVVAGRVIDGQTITPAAVFRQTFQDIVTKVVATKALVVAANIPDVTTIPFVTTIPYYVVNPGNRQPVLVDGQKVPLLGPAGPLSAGSYVTLAASSLLAQGYGIPATLGGKGQPLPDNVILDPSEIAILSERVVANNQAIAEICAASGIPVVDMNAVLAQIASGGRSYAGIRLTATFLTGGMFSYDGIHPTELGYAVIANEFIATTNAQKGTTIPPVDLGPFLGLTARTAKSSNVSPDDASRRSLGDTSSMAPTAEFTPEAWGALALVFPEVGRP
jgi:lysophospholipase L1-like esterase